MKKVSHEVLREKAKENICHTLSNRLNERLGREDHVLVCFDPEIKRYLFFFHLPSDHLCFMKIIERNGMLQQTNLVIDRRKKLIQERSSKDERFLNNVFHVGTQLLCEEPLYRLPFLTGTLKIKEYEVY